ncbi:hypothetical protein T01_2034, partial [Trichinella spiralis]
LSYQVQTEDGQLWRRHTEQFKKTLPQSGGFRSRDTDAQSLECDPQSRRRQWRRCIPHPALPGTDSADSGSLPVSSTLFWQLKPSLLHYP